MTVESNAGLSPMSEDLGTNKVPFHGDRTSMTSFPSTPRWSSSATRKPAALPATNSYPLLFEPEDTL